MKNKLPIIISIIFLAACIGVTVWSLFPASPTNDPSGEGENANALFDAGEYWSADFDKSHSLKKTVVGENGFILSIHYYDLHPYYGEEAGEFKREIFCYEDNRLTHSITYGYNSTTAKLDGKKYETRYVYEGDRIVGAQVFTPRGTPTLSYDEYEYTSDGQLMTVKRYEYGELDRVYHFNGKNFPEYVDVGELSYALTYDENGNLLSAKEKNGVAEANAYSITYEGKSPVRFVFDYYAYDFDHGYGVKQFDMTFRFNKKGLLTEHCGEFFTHNEKGAVTFIESVYEGKTTSTIERIYDQKGRLSERNEINYYFMENEDVPFDTYVQTKTIHGYDKDGNLLGYTNTYGEKSTEYLYEYDKDGNLIKKTATSQASNYHKVTEYEYEFYPSGRLKKKTYRENNGELCGNEYAENGNVTIEYSYGTITEYLSYDVAYPFSRTESSRRSAKVKCYVFEKSRIDYEYDENNRLLGWVDTYNDGRREVAECYENENIKILTEYDKDGNVVSVTRYTEDGKIVN